MSSQATKMQKNYDEYMKRPLINPNVVMEMNRLMDYANTIDTDSYKTASEILLPQDGEEE